MSKKITELFVVVATNDVDGDETGDEGIMGGMTPLGVTPMVTGSEDILKVFCRIADASGQAYVVKRFVLQEDMVLN